MRDDSVIADLVRAVVSETLDDDKGAAVPALEKKRLSPKDRLLAKKVANWIGSEAPLIPALGKWKPRGDFAHYLSRTQARLAVGRAGTRLQTGTALSFQEDHASARDAVHSGFEGSLLDNLGLRELCSRAKDKQEFLLRPDLGRQLSDESRKIVEQTGRGSFSVQIVAADGLSAQAINRNLPLILSDLEKKLASKGIRTGKRFVIKNGRVSAGDEVGRLTNARVLVMLVGERPGLLTAESMGVYITWMRARNFNEAMRFVISNIHENGLKPSEAVDQIVSLVEKALREKKTGIQYDS
mgnify:CR=1 FL=1